MDWCSCARGWPFRYRRSAHLTGGAVPQDIRLRPRLSKLLVHLFVRPLEVTMLNKLVFENLRQRPVRTCLSVLAIGVEVTMILTLVGISYGTLDETARCARGVEADIPLHTFHWLLLSIREENGAALLPKPLSHC